MSLIVLSAGGTGGHLFPAQALAGELVRRGKTIVVMTDRRGTNYAKAFPGAAIETVPSAAFSDRSVLGLVAAPFEIVAGIVMSLIKLARIKPAAVIGFGGYPSVPVMIAAIIARIPTAILAPDAVLWAAANRLVANHGARDRRRPSRLLRFPPKDHVQGRLHRQSDAPRSDRAGGRALRRADRRTARCICSSSAAARARAPSARSFPPRVALLPHRTCATALDIVQQCRPEDLEAVRAAYAVRRREGGARAVLQRSARAHGEGATGDRALRRRHGERTGGDRPSRHPGAAAACAGRQPDAQCRRAGECRRRLARAPERADAAEAGGNADAILLRRRPIWPSAPPPRAASPRPTERSASPMPSRRSRGPHDPRQDPRSARRRHRSISSASAASA